MRVRLLVTWPSNLLDNMAIPYGKQTIDDEDVSSVSDTLNSDFLTTGPKIEEFEKKFALYTGSKYAVAVSSGTAGLHLACLAAGLSEGDELITTPMTFAASSNCALYCGARPVFADINESGLINPEKIKDKVTIKSKIIIPVHYMGLPCDLKEIKEIADKNNLVVIEDACHALGATYENTKIGDCRYSDMAVFSFHPVKQITTGEGGMITTNSIELYNKLKMLRTHGITREQDKFHRKNEGSWYHEMQTLGFNYRITDFQCALGVSQLKKIGWFLKRRREIANRYNSYLNSISQLELIKSPQDRDNAYHLFVLKVKDATVRRNLFDFLKSKGILCQVHYIPVYWHPYYKSLGYKEGICPVAEDFYHRIISIPIYPSLKDEEQDYVTKAIKSFFIT